MKRRLLLLLLPLVVYCAAVALLGNWIIDDAGISFAYARNLGRGHGFVSQPGRPPVEGFSNLLWVILLSPLARWSWFDPIVWSKLLGGVSMLACFAVVARVFKQPLLALAVSLFLATSPPLVVWTTSGLENGLMLVLAMILWALLSERPRRWALAGGVVAGLMAATHPEGLLYLAVPTLAAAFGEGPRQERVDAAGQAVVGGMAVMGPLFILRLAIFHLPLPHTFYAKSLYPSPWDHTVDLLSSPYATLARFAEVARGAAGPAGPWLLFAGWVGLFMFRRNAPRWLSMAALIQAVGAAAYVWLDLDWMGEYRFATVPIAMTPLVLFGALRAATASAAVPALSLGLAAILGFLGVPRLWRFAANPPTPMADVDGLRAKLDAWKAELGLPRASVFLADIGAPLWASSLEVFDAAGLCQPEVIQTLKDEGPTWHIRNQPFYDWFFESARPTFVVTSGFWSVVSQLNGDPRWLRDYLPVDAYLDVYAERVYGVRTRSGTWVRRDALGSPGALARLRAHGAPALPSTLAWRLYDRLYPIDDPTQLAAEAKAARGRNDARRAAVLWRRRASRYPADTAAWRMAAEALDASGQVDEGRRIWLKVRELALRSGDKTSMDAAHDRLDDPEEEIAEAGWMNDALAALYQKNDPPTAVSLLKTILAQTPAHFGASFQLARALEAAGQKKEALEQWKHFRAMPETANDAPSAKMAEDRIHALESAVE
jgi:hypothetical protein